MSKNLRNLLLICGIFPLTFSVTNTTTLTSKIEHTSKASILNYDSSLGIFKDLNKDEVKSYYNNLNSKTGIKGDEFLTELQNIIKDGHTKVSNSLAWSSDWKLFTLLDRDYENDPLTNEEISSQIWKKDDIKIIPLYTDKTTFKKSSKSVDREHIWPKSRGFKFANSSSESGDEQPYAATDMHNLRMGESKNNQNGHNNYPFGNVINKSSIDTTQIKSTYTNEVTGYLGLNENGVKVYEPRDEDKGDIARSLFYMAARYHNYIDASSFQPALKLVNFSSKDKPTETINAIDTKDSPATYGNLQTLLEWNILDPVNEFEIHRNNLVYNAVQHNRNPFIDYPSWADVAFGNKTLDLNQENGVSTNDPYIVTHDSKRKYYLNDKIKPSDFKLTYYDSKGNKTELDTSSTLVKMFYIDEENNEIFIKDEYKLSKVGSFKIKFTYFKDNVIYTAYCDIEVKELNLKEKVLNFYEQNKIIILISASVLILVIVIVLTLIKKKKYKKGKQNKKNSTPKRKK